MTVDKSGLMQIQNWRKERNKDMCGALQNLLAVLCVVGLSAFITILVLLIAVCVCGNHEIIDCFWFPLPEVGICAILSIRKSHRAKGGCYYSQSV